MSQTHDTDVATSSLRMWGNSQRSDVGPSYVVETCRKVTHVFVGDVTLIEIPYSENRTRKEALHSQTAPRSATNRAQRHASIVD